ncbi:MAG: DUF4407 domain-containing protein [Bacteroidales bacterium]
MTKKNRFLKFACAITGDDFDLLVMEPVPSRRKVKLLALSVFLPTFIWAVSGFLLAQKILNLDLLTSIFISLGASLLIFSLERVIIMGPSKRIVRNMRIVLGIVIALLGAFVTDNVIFHNDLMGQLNEMKITAGNQAAAQIEQELKPERARLDSLLALAYNNWQSALAAAAAEADGTGGSGRKGVDAITRLKLSNAQRLEREYRDAREQRKHFDITKEAKIAEARLKAEKTYENPGLLTMIKTSVRFIFSHWVVAIIYLLFLLLIGLIEIIPVTLKFYLDETSYEKKIAAMEKISERRLEMVLNLPATQKLSTSHRQEYTSVQQFN